MSCPRCGAELRELSVRLIGSSVVTVRDRCSENCGYESLPETRAGRIRRKRLEKRMAAGAERRQRMGTPPDDPYWVR